MRWWALARNTLAAAIADDILDWSASLAFYFLFALFPAILIVASILGTLNLQGLNLLTDALGRRLPPQAMPLVSRALASLLTHHVPELFSLGLVLLLFSASQGFTGMMAALNAAYEVPETRPYWRRELLALGLTFSAGLLMAIALALLLWGQRLVALLAARLPVAHLGVVLGLGLRWGVTAGFLLLSVRMLFRYAPNLRHEPRGALASVVVALLLWFAASAGLAFYSSHFGRIAMIYGSLGAVITLMLWFYVLALSLLLGAELHNEWLKLHGIHAAPPERSAPPAHRAA